MLIKQRKSQDFRNEVSSNSMKGYDVVSAISCNRRVKVLSGSMSGSGSVWRPPVVSSRLSDSYGLYAEADIRHAGELIDLDFFREKKNVLFQDSRVAVFRHGPFMLVADAMEHLWGHPQTLLFYENEPILIDSGQL